MRAEGLKSKDDLGMSRIFFAGGLGGWLQTVPAPRVAAAGPSPTPHRSTRLGAQPRPLRFRSRSHANKPASERPRPETSHLPPNRPRRQLRLVAHHAVRPHCEQANRADLAVHRCRFGTLWLWVAIRTRGRGHLRAAAGRPVGRWVTFAQAAAVAASFDREKDRTRHAAKNMLHAPCCLPRLPGSTWSRHGCRRAARAARQCRSCVRSCGQRGGARSSPGGPPPWRAPSLQTRGSSLGSSSPPDSWAHQASYSRTGEAGGTGSM